VLVECTDTGDFAEESRLGGIKVFHTPHPVGGREFGDNRPLRESGGLKTSDFSACILGFDAAPIGQMCAIRPNMVA
jgi:hypothetical protein